MSKGLSLDMGKNHTGFALWLDGNLLHVGRWRYTVDAHQVGELLTRFRSDLKALHVEWGVFDWIAYEDGRPNSHYQREIHFGMAGVVREDAFKLSVPVIQVTPPAAKKRLFGKGKALKSEMLESAQNLYPEQNITTDDMADAIAVGLVALDMIVGPVVV